MSRHVREPIKQLFALGPLPDEADDEEYPESFFQQFEALLEEIKAPLNLEEARLLVQLFPSVSCYGLDWALLHLIESAPQRPVDEIVELCQSVEWKQCMIARSRKQA